MTPPIPPLPTPEPVKQLVALGGLVSAAVVAVGGAVTLVAAHKDLDTVASAVGVAVVAVGSLVAFTAPYVAALLARRRVTPTRQPRDADGGVLVRADGLPLIAERTRPAGPQRPGVADHAAD